MEPPVYEGQSSEEHLFRRVPEGWVFTTLGPYYAGSVAGRRIDLFGE